MEQVIRYLVSVILPKFAFYPYLFQNSYVFCIRIFALLRLQLNYCLSSCQIITHEFSDRRFVFAKSIDHSIQKIHEELADVLLFVYRDATAVVIYD